MVEIRETKSSHENGIRGEKSLSKEQRERNVTSRYFRCLFVLLAGLERTHEDEDDDDDDTTSTVCSFGAVINGFTFALSVRANNGDTRLVATG